VLARQRGAGCAAWCDGFRGKQAFYGGVVEHEVLKGFAVPGKVPSSFSSTMSRNRRHRNDPVDLLPASARAGPGGSRGAGQPGAGGGPGPPGSRHRE
jgi:hypothetical protein